TARTVPAVAEIVERRPTDRLMGARRAVLPGAERGSTNPIGRATQTGSRTGIEVSVPHAIARRTRPVTEIVEIGLSDGLLRSADGIEVVQGRGADVGAGTGLRKGHTGDQQYKEK